MSDATQVPGHQLRLKTPRKLAVLLVGVVGALVIPKLLLAAYNNSWIYEREPGMTWAEPILRTFQYGLGCVIPVSLAALAIIRPSLTRLCLWCMLVCFPLGVVRGVGDATWFLTSRGPPATEITLALLRNLTPLAFVLWGLHTLQRRRALVGADRSSAKPLLDATVAVLIASAILMFARCGPWQTWQTFSMPATPIKRDVLEIAHLTLLICWWPVLLAAALMVRSGRRWVVFALRGLVIFAALFLLAGLAQLTRESLRIGSRPIRFISLMAYIGSYLDILVVVGLITGVWFRVLVRGRLIEEGECGQCGYRLLDWQQVCPECGTPVGGAPKSVPPAE